MQDFLNTHTQKTDMLTRTTCPVDISRFEVTGSSDLKIYRKLIKHYTLSMILDLDQTRPVCSDPFTDRSVELLCVLYTVLVLNLNESYYATL